MSNPNPPGGTLSGLTDDEAREFHRIFITSFILFTVIAIVAHFLVWQWRPWLPGEGGYASLIDNGRLAIDLAKSHLV
ncbi:MAG: light-harvesting antenna LH1, beta subunit [Alphaproteobacteria bacterium]